MTKSAKGTKANPGKNVRQKAALNRSILAQGWGVFRKRLSDKTTNAQIPVKVISVLPAYTSQCYFVCGNTDK